MTILVVELYFREMGYQQLGSAIVRRIHMAVTHVQYILMGSHIWMRSKELLFVLFLDPFSWPT
jgi:hypothetical protein